MIGILPQTELQIVAFGLILLRTSAFVVTWPVWSIQSVPQLAKILFAVSMSIILSPFVSLKGLATVSSGLNLIQCAVMQAFIGISMGFVARLFFFVLNSAGDLIAMAMGLTSAQVFNPLMSVQTTAIDNFYLSLATLIFMAIQGHHYFLKALFASFDRIPISALTIHLVDAQYIGRVLQTVVVCGVQLAAPVLLTLFLLNLALGIANRAVPQLNVLALSFPITIMAGLLVLTVVLPLFSDQLSEVFNVMAGHLFYFMSVI